MNVLLRGSIAGTIGTILMTMPIILARRFHLFFRIPPEEISENIEAQADAIPESTESVFTRCWPIPHVMYGIAGGILFSASRRRIPLSTLNSGVLFGILVWIASYAGFLPVLGLYPSPKDDRPPRIATMILAHVVYGGTVALSDKRINDAT